MATRNQILRVLSDVKQILLRAQQFDDNLIDTTISNISMDTLDESNTGLGLNTVVEQCICPPGYTGLSCESCAPGYTRTTEGRCLRQQDCPSGYYLNPRSGQCDICPCPLTTPSNQFGRTCSIDSDGQVTCDCSVGYTGRRCGDCAAGYYGNPAVPGGSCNPGASCESEGSYDLNPDPSSGVCRCREGHTGSRCEVKTTSCGEYRFQSVEESAPGCMDCFCMGVLDRMGNKAHCQASGLHRYKEELDVKEDIEGITLADRRKNSVIPSQELIIDSGSQEISYARFLDQVEMVYYWNLPYQFVGSKISCYGGHLEFSLRYVPDKDSGEYKSLGVPLVQIQGNNIKLAHSSDPVSFDAPNRKFKVKMHESAWSFEPPYGRSKVTRADLMLVLADLDSILIRATPGPTIMEAGLSGLSLDCAVNRTTGAGLASAVEGCVCPQGYKGLSCEDCAPGYTRSGSGPYLGSCTACQCNGKSLMCHPESGECLECRDHTTGFNCDECEPGFRKDFVSGGCLPDSPEQCSCDARGSKDLNCINNQFCRCKDNVEGTNCDRCRPATYGLSQDNPQGCSQCYCSGVTTECADARLYWSTMRLNAHNKEYTITDKNGDQIRHNQVTFDEVTQEDLYRLTSEDRNAILYWKLPIEVSGSRLGAYGGNLTIIQRYISEGGSNSPVSGEEPALIIKSSGGKNLVYPEGGDMMREPRVEIRNKFTLLPGDWMVEDRGRKRPANREDILSVLSDVEGIYVKATMSEGTMETAIRKAMIDIAVPQMTGGPLVAGAEECRCPPGYVGLSCEACALGYFRDWNDMSQGPGGKCVRCPCSQNENSCSLMASSQVQCNCKPGYSGSMCEYRDGEVADGSQGGGPLDLPPDSIPITITVNEPRIQIIEVGRTATFNCDALPLYSSQDPMVISWAKENGLLPSGRAVDDGQGLLIISSVKYEDSGTYICTATSGRFIKTSAAVLNVGGEDSPSPPAATIQPPYLEVETGGNLQLTCDVNGSPEPSVSWTRGQGYPLSRRALVRGATLYIPGVSLEDAGEYVCTATNAQGSTSTRARVHISQGSGSGSPDNLGSGRDSGQGASIVISPQDMVISVGDQASFLCEIIGPNGDEGFRISWSRVDGYLSETANEGQLILRNVRPEQSGLYKCTARGPGGQILESQVYLTVTSTRGPPSVSIQPEDQTVGQGGSTELRCMATGDPQPSITWSKVGEEMNSPNVVLSNSNTVLSIRNAAITDRGMYMCTAENSGGSARATSIVEVERREPPRIEVYPDTRQTVTKSGSVLFQCRTLAGIPSPVVTWTRADGRPLDSHIEILRGGVMRINRVIGSEAGEYKCRAQNEAGSTEAVASLIVQEIPTIALEPKGSVTMQVGAKLRIECTVSGDPRPTIAWKRIKSTGSVPLPLTSSAYEVQSLTKDDEGTYACVASNAAGQTEERVQIIVLEPDEYQSYPNLYPDNAPGGDRYPPAGERYPSSGDRYPDNSQDDGRNPDPYVDSNRYPDRSGYPGGSRNPDPRYPGIAGGSESRFGGGQLAGEQVTPRSGSTITLECLTYSNIGQMTATWRRQDNRRLPTRHYQSEGVLHLNQVDEDDETTYVCVVKDQTGITIYERKTELKIMNPPNIRLEPERQTVRPGSNPTVTCLATGAEPLQIYWSKDSGDPLPGGISQSNGVLQFRSISVSDEGTYLCTASNSDGTAEARSEVIVTDERTGSGPPAQFSFENNPTRDSEKGYPLPRPSSQEKGYPLPQRRDEKGYPLPQQPPEQKGYPLPYPPQQAPSDPSRNYNYQSPQDFYNSEDYPPIQPYQPSSSYPQPPSASNNGYPQPPAAPSYSDYQPSSFGANAPAANFPEVNYDTDEMDYYEYSRMPGHQDYEAGDPDQGGPGSGGQDGADSSSQDYYGRGGDERPPQRVNGDLDGAVSLQCPLEGQVTWTKDGAPLPPTAQQYGSNLRIGRVQVSDGGRYTCTGSSGLHYIDLIVKPDAVECKPLEFSCLERAGCVPRFQVCDGEIDCTDGSDEMNCGMFRRKRSPKHVLFLGENPDVSILSSNQAPEAGDSLSLTCEVNGSTRGGAAFNWSKLGSIQLPDNSNSQDNILRFDALTMDEEGVYRCEVQTRFGIFYADFNLTVLTSTQQPDNYQQAELNNEPAVAEIKTRIKEPLRLDIGAGMPVDLQCTLEAGEPVIWTKQHGIIKRDSVATKGTLTIFSVEESDAGVYVCKAEVGEEKFILTVTGIVPYFNQAPISYVQYPTLVDAYLEFTIQISFRPEKDGLILFNGQDDQGNSDFVAFGLKFGHPEFRFKLGGGVAKLQSDIPVQPGRWHTVTLWRNKKNASMILDDNPGVYGQAKGIFQGLDLVKSLYVGGLPSYENINDDVGFTRGFVGCISRLALGPRHRDITKTSIDSVGVTGCETCAQDPCNNAGICQESNSHTGYTCICPQGFSGRNCSKIGESCYPGVCGEGSCINTPTGIACLCNIGTSGARCRDRVHITKPAFDSKSYLAFDRPKHILRRLNIALKFKAKDLRDSILFYCSQSELGKGDFASLAIRNGYLEFRYDTGSGPAILRSRDQLKLNHWHSVKMRRKLREGMLYLDREAPVIGKSPGTTRGLNIRTPIYIGGVNQEKFTISTSVKVTEGFTGCIAGLEVGGKHLDMVEDAVDSGHMADCMSMSPCEIRPCQNGGTCSEIDTSRYKCSCMDGWTGINCEQEVSMCDQAEKPLCGVNGRCHGNATAYTCHCNWGFVGPECTTEVSIEDEIGFRKNSFIELNGSLLHHYDLETPQVISIDFSTDQPDGIILWQGKDLNGGDFLAISIENGHPCFQFELGGGPAKLIIQSVRVDDGELHNIEARRRGRSGELILDSDKDTMVSGKSQGVLGILNTKYNIYLGGAPDLSRLTGGRWDTGFQGCVYNVTFYETEIDFSESNSEEIISTANIRPCDALSTQEDEAYYSNLLDDMDSEFDEDAYLERLQRINTIQS